MSPSKLRTGFTTGACATATSAAAFGALMTGQWTNSVSIQLPRGGQATFALCLKEHENDWAMAGTIKDAGDDPDVTHGALIRSKVWLDDSRDGIQFLGGEGVGVVTKPGLPIPVGEPAINPVPREMITNSIRKLANELQVPSNVVVEISIPGGQELARKTWNPRLGIEGGLSILGTTGIVKPFSCSAWIASIHMGIDVALANGTQHVCASTGSVSERTAQKHLGLPDWAMLDMGDFVGGTIKYLRHHPIPNLTIAGGFGKLSKLANGATDLHSRRSQVDFEFLHRLAAQRLKQPNSVDVSAIRTANTASQIVDICGHDIARAVAFEARSQARKMLKGSPIKVNVMIVDRQGAVIALTHSDSDDRSIMDRSV